MVALNDDVQIQMEGKVYIVFFRGISKIDFEAALLPHLTHSNPCLLPFDFIFLLHFLQVGLTNK